MGRAKLSLPGVFAPGWFVAADMCCGWLVGSLLAARLPVQILPGALSCREGMVFPECLAEGSGA